GGHPFLQHGQRRSLEAPLLSPIAEPEAEKQKTKGKGKNARASENPHFCLFAFTFSHAPARMDAVAVVEDVGRPVARFRGRTASDVVRGGFRTRPAGMAVEEDVV